MTDVRPLRLLFVDDEPEVTRSIRALLRRSPHTVEIADSGEEALEKLAAGRFDMVVSDERMPGLQGSELLARVREEWPETVRVILTGQADMAAVANAINKAEIFRFLMKPCGAEELRDVIDEAARFISRRDLEQPSRATADDGDADRFELALSGLWLAAQPIVFSSETGRSFAYEALMRVEGMSPLELLALGEGLGGIDQIDERVWACVSALTEDLPDGRSLFVNVHPRSLEHAEFFALLEEASHRDRIVLELTERETLGTIVDFDEKVARIRSLGFRLAIDDLGAGYAGLSSFAALEPDFVKFDMELIRGVEAGSTKGRLIESICRLCNELGIQTVAEGIETDAERATIRALGCDYLQGYLFAKPGKPFPVPCGEKPS